jgi:hypothetical protein
VELRKDIDCNGGDVEEEGISIVMVKLSRDHSKNCMMRLISTRRFKPYAYII